jgi:hypothetical protein
MTSKAKQKGNSWELAICKFLGLELGGNWMRVPNSGAAIGGQNSSKKIFMDDGQIRLSKGDIIPPLEFNKLNLEAKNYASIAFHQIINGECKQLNSWIEQTETPAEPNDCSLTIFKITRKGSWVVFNADLVDKFKLATYVYYKKSDDRSYIITDFESFVKTNKEILTEIGSKGI